jgi:hypothetical protein
LIREFLIWLQQYDSLLQSLEHHAIYVHLRAEENHQDVDDANADDALGNAEDLNASTPEIHSGRTVADATTRQPDGGGTPAASPDLVCVKRSSADAAHRASERQAPGGGAA